MYVDRVVLGGDFLQILQVSVLMRLLHHVVHGRTVQHTQLLLGRRSRRVQLALLYKI